MYQFPLNQTLAPLFTSALPTLLTTLSILCVLSVDSVSRLNVVFMVSGTMIWSLEPCGISVSVCWFG